MSFPAYSAYKDSGVEWLGEVPQHWPVYSLKRTVDGCVNGLWGDEPDGENDIAVIRVADFERSFSAIGLDKLTYRSITPKEKQSRLIKSGDLLIEKSGGGEKTLVGCVVLFSHKFEAITSNFVARMRPLSEFDRQFLCYAFGNLYHGRVNYPSVKQVTGIQNLDAESYLQERFCFPPRAEQTQITRFLDHETARIDALIEEQQRLIELLKEKRQAVISHAVTKGLAPTVPMKDSGVELLGEVPAHWAVAGLKWFWSVTDCKHITAEFVDDGIHLASIREVQSRYVVLDNAKQTTEVFYRQLIEGGRALVAGDLIFSRNATVGEVAQVASWHPPFAMGQDVCVLKKQYEWLSSDYLQAVLRSPVVMVQLDNLKIGSTFKRVNVEDIRGIIVPMPPQGEQKIIAEYLIQRTEMFDSMLEEVQNTIALLQERRSALISAAVTGKIDVRGWQPPASAQAHELAQEAV